MKTALCLLVRNERRDIAEWIAFHALLGFDAQIIFDHRSDDGTDRIIRQAARHYDIRHHAWTDDGTHWQINAYTEALRRHRHEFDWIAFLDSDEFLVPAREQSIEDLLAPYDDFAAIAIPWAIYGSNGHIAYPNGLVIENYTRRAGENFFPAHHVKSIVRPTMADRALNPHCFVLAEGRYGTLAGQPAGWWPTDNGQTLPGVLAGQPDYGVARINHYFTRSESHWRAKLRRSYPNPGEARRMDEFAHYNRNEVADPIALRYAPRVRDIVARIDPDRP